MTSLEIIHAREKITWESRRMFEIIIVFNTSNFEAKLTKLSEEIHHFSAKIIDVQQQFVMVLLSWRNRCDSKIGKNWS